MPARSRTVVIVSFSYLPTENARTLRWSAIARDWVARGMRVSVVSGLLPDSPTTECIDGVDVHRVGGRLVERLRQAAARRRTGTAAGLRNGSTASARSFGDIPIRIWRALHWPDSSCFWYWSALREAIVLLGKQPDARLVSVSPAFTSVAVGRSLKVRFPYAQWLVDLGDPFSLAREEPPNNILLYGALNRRVEAACLRQANAIAVTNHATCRRYTAAFPGIAGKIAVIPPVVTLDRESMSGNPSVRGARKRLGYFGRLYAGIRRPAFLLALFDALLRDGNACELHFFGEMWPCEADFNPYARHLDKTLFLHSSVPHRDVGAAMRSMDVLVNIGNSTSYQLPSKLVEYAALGKPILSLVHGKTDLSAEFLAGYPQALAIDVEAGRPAPADVESLRRFLDAAADLAAGDAARWAAPYSVEMVSAAYRALLGID